MIILELNSDQRMLFEEYSKIGTFQYEVIESKKLGGGEIIFQVVITAVNIAAPYIINCFKDSKVDNRSITLIRDGIRIRFEDENELKKFLESNPSNEND